MGRRNDIDWEAIEKEYRLGQKSLRQIAVVFGVQPSAISRKAKKDSWVQDKASEVRALSEAQLLISNRRKATEKATPTPEDVQVAALARTNIVLNHRTDVRDGRELAMQMLEELKAQTADLDLFRKLGELMLNPDDKGNDKLSELYHKVISTSGRMGNLKQWAEVQKILIALERQAFGIDDDSKGAGKLEDWLDEL